MATDDGEPSYGGRHCTAIPPQTNNDQTRRDRLRGWGERIADLGRIQRYCTAFVLTVAAGTTVGASQVISASSGLLRAGFGSMFTLFMLATVIVLTIGGSNDGGADESGSPTGSARLTEQMPFGWRRH